MLDNRTEPLTDFDVEVIRCPRCETELTVVVTTEVELIAEDDDDE